MANPPRQSITPLDYRTPIVDPETGAPTLQFVRLWQQLFGNEQNSADGLAAKADKAIVLTAGVGLNGGGDLSADRTFDLADTAVTPSTYGDATNIPQITVDQQGRITSLATVPAAGGGGGSVVGPQIYRSFVSTGAGTTQTGLSINTTTGTKSNAVTGAPLVDSIPAVNMSTTAAVNNINAYFTNTGPLRRGSVTGGGGFSFSIRVNPLSVAGACTWSAGITRAAIVLPYAGEASSLFDTLMIGVDSTDTNLQLMHNDAAGAATKIDLGASFPGRNASAVYILELTCPSGAGSAVDYTVTRLDTGDVATGTLTTNLPTQDTNLGLGVYINNLALGAVRTLKFYDCAMQS